MTAALTIQGLKLGFYGVQVLRGVDFAVPQGSFTGLIGPNGAGKSTLFNAVSGLYRPQAGSVRLGATETAGMPPEKLVAAGLVRSFQLARGLRGELERDMQGSGATACYWTPGRCHRAPSPA